MKKGGLAAIDGADPAALLRPPSSAGSPAAEPRVLARGHAVRPSPLRPRRAPPAGARGRARSARRTRAGAARRRAAGPAASSSRSRASSVPAWRSIRCERSLRGRGQVADRLGRGALRAGRDRRLGDPAVWAIRSSAPPTSASQPDLELSAPGRGRRPRGAARAVATLPRQRFLGRLAALARPPARTSRRAGGRVEPLGAPPTRRASCSRGAVHALGEPEARPPRRGSGSSPRSSRPAPPGGSTSSRACAAQGLDLRRGSLRRSSVAQRLDLALGLVEDALGAGLDPLLGRADPLLALLAGELQLLAAHLARQARLVCSVISSRARWRALRSISATCGGRDLAELRLGRRRGLLGDRSAIAQRPSSPPRCRSR